MELAEIINMDDFRRRKNPVFNDRDLAYMMKTAQNYESPFNLAINIYYILQYLR